MKTLFITSACFSIDLLVFVLLIFHLFVCNVYCKCVLLFLPFLSNLHKIFFPEVEKYHVVFIRVSNTSYCDTQSEYFIGLKHESLLLTVVITNDVFSDCTTGGDSEPCRLSKEWLTRGSLRFRVEDGGVARWKESCFWGFNPSTSSCFGLFELWFPSCHLSGTLDPIWSSSTYTCVWERASRQKYGQM